MFARVITVVILALGAVLAPAKAQQPWTGVIRVILEPTVCTIRQPPTSVPSPIMAWQMSTTQNGT